ncbi:hypothetical protein WA026_021582 [Henosepilachna vigintioctopunctata]|uniref:Uncharacterized protein n=1 Tax=Henosepilachna vigintioctopunctata TaxID=420089 RepID=A0AAW1V2E4_9CUCU
MISNSVFYILSLLLISLSLVWSLDCIKCTAPLIKVETTSSDIVPCENRTDGAITCQEGVLCYTIYHNNKTVERDCGKADYCKDKENGTCGTCTESGCIPKEFKSSAHRENAIPAALLAGTIFLIMGR